MRTHLAEEEAEHAGDVAAAHLVASLAAGGQQAVHQLLGDPLQVLVGAGAGQDLQGLRARDQIGSDHAAKPWPGCVCAMEAEMTGSVRSGQIALI